MIEFIFGVYGDAYWAFDQFMNTGINKGYVTWTDILEINRKTETFIDNPEEYNNKYMDKGWNEIGESHIEPVDENNNDGQWKFVLPEPSYIRKGD